ncbi:hypothetical protein EV182_000875 [Spiromyces aspiralis]|uniref:Uncharacterized protein n=1 Tax=Spiromyces aspiralis TaxID=68401 RepID=A0ACC1HJY3_9FUNG|nr:hypothetical protein EV182_000875 [Spiromyces aspiralis]
MEAFIDDPDTIKNIDYILVAEFDIDEGSILRHQYPRPTGANENHIAELMLPDGAHLRENDWTVFFFNQQVPEKDGLLPPDAAPLLYALSLVRTKHDKGVRRGAVVKAMAVCTRHQFLHIFKPILLLALENYYRSPTVDTLKQLYDSVNSMDLSGMPKLSRSERIILRFSDDQAMFEEKFVEHENERQNSEPLQPQKLPTVDNANGSNSMLPKSPSTLKSAFSNPEHHHHHQQQQQQRQLASESGRQKKMLDLTSGQMRVSTGKAKDRHFYDTQAVYEGVKLPIRVPMTVYPEEIGDFSLIQLLTTFGSNPQFTVNSRGMHPHLDSSGHYTHPIILLLNGLLTQKRIIFLGHNRPAGEVSNYVLAAVALGSGGGGVLRGFANRAFPYTNLTNLDTLLSFPGYIAGVTNPTFEEHPQWWDLLCNINTGKITVSPTICSSTGSSNGHGYRSAAETIRKSLDSAGLTRNRSVSTRDIKPDRWNNSDAEFIHDLMGAIDRHYGEIAIRAKVEAFVRRFVSLTALYEHDHKGSTKLGINFFTDGGASAADFGLYFPDFESKERELLLNQRRIEGFIGTTAYYNAREDFQTLLRDSPIPGIDISALVSRLRYGSNLELNEIEAIYKLLDEHIQTDEQVTELLATLPQSKGGLHPLAFGFYHPSVKIRRYTVELFERIEKNKAGARYIKSVNFFHQCAFSNLRQTFTPAAT